MQVSKKAATNFVRRPLHQHSANINLQRAITRADKHAEDSGMNMNIVCAEGNTDNDGELNILSDFQLKARTSGSKPQKLTILYSTEKGYVVPIS